MPKYFVTATEVIFYRGTVEADSEDDLYEKHQQGEIQEHLEEYDSEAMVIQIVEEVE